MGKSSREAWAEKLGYGQPTAMTWEEKLKLQPFPVQSVPSKSAKPNKYRNRKFVNARGEAFDGEKEAERWEVLRLLDGTVLKHLKRQVRIPLMINGKVWCHWQPDFVYTLIGEAAKGKTKKECVVVEDFKSDITMTKDFMLKKKAFEIITGKKVRISKSPHDVVF